MVKITFVVQEDGTRSRLRSGHTRDTEKRKLEVITIGRLNFSPRDIADCYVFESDVALSPWIMNLGRYLPNQCDWTTTTEILERAGFKSGTRHDSPVDNNKPDIALDLILEGKVVPFEPFAVTWLFMRRHYSKLFSEEARKQIGCSPEHYRNILKHLRATFEETYKYRHGYEDARAENCVTIADFLVSGPPNSFGGIGEKGSNIIRNTLKLYGLKMFGC